MEKIMKKIGLDRRKIEVFIICILTPLLVGSVSSLLSGNMKEIYAGLNKPSLSPDPSIFGIAWTILYVMMGIASYFIFESNSQHKEKALKLYKISLIFNFFWSILFFRFDNQLIALIWILIYVFVVINLLMIFYRIKPTAGYLLIPYLAWLLFATYLNLSIFLLNR